MARPRQFDLDAALDMAMRSFWKYGYQNVSFDDLVKKTGASRHSLYSQFRDKQGLLVQALYYYERNILQELITELNRQDKSPLVKLNTFFHQISKIARKDSEGAGCLMCTIHIETTKSEEIQKHTKSFFENLRRAFLKQLREAQKNQELPNERDIDKLSHYLIGLVIGISINARRKATDKSFGSFLEIALEVIN